MMEATMGRFKCMLDNTLELLHKQIDQMKNSFNQQQKHPSQMSKRNCDRTLVEESDESNDEE